MARNQKSVAKIAFFSLLVVLVVGLGALLVIGSPCIDERTGCPCPGEARHDAVTLSILLDATDPYGAAQKRSVVDAVWDEVDALAEYDRVKVYSVRQTPEVPDFNRCKPARELGKPSIENDLREALFNEFLDDSLQKLQGTRPSSPIISSLGWVASDRERDGSARRVLLVSDLIENSDVLSQYDPGWLDDYERNRERIHDQCPMLDETDVDILFPTRPSQPAQDNVLVKWWLDYFRACGGRVQSVRKITGTD